MHVSDLAELAAVTAIYTPTHLAAGWELAPRHLERYWTASKCRLDRWQRTLKELRDYTPQSDAEGPLKPLLEEIFAGEVLTRVWTAAVTAREMGRETSEAEPLVRNIFAGHLEARNRALRFLVAGRAFTPRQHDSLNLLRRRMERWTDALLAHLAPAVDILPWCFDPERAADFVQDLQESPSPSLIVIPYVTASIRAAVRAGVRAPAPSAGLNQQLAASIVACFPGEQYDFSNLPITLWVERVNSAAEDAQVLLDELHLLEGNSPVGGSPWKDWSH